MIIQLQPSQVSLMWDVIKVGLIKARSVPEHLSLEYTNKQLSDILSGNVQCWAVYTEGEGKKEIRAIVTSRIVNNSIYGHKQLILETVHKVSDIAPELYLDSYTMLEKFAERAGCKSVVVETEVPAMKQMLQSINFKEYETRFMKFI